MLLLGQSRAERAEPPGHSRECRWGRCSPWSMDRGASWLDLTACRLSLKANIPTWRPVAFQNNRKGGPCGGMPSIRTSYFGRFRPCRRICASCFPFSKNCTVGRFQLQRHLPPAPAMPPASGGINQVDKQMVPVDFNSSFRVW